MLPEGQNKSEEKLHRYAKERRERGGDFSLHPATRQMLQGEVTRQFGKAESRPESKGWWAILMAFPRRLAAGGVLAVLVLTCLVVWNNSKRESRMQMAQATQAESELSLRRAEDRGWMETGLDKEQSKLPSLEKKLSPTKTLSDERLLTLNATAESDSKLAEKPAEPSRLGVDSISRTVTVTNSAIVAFSYQANPAESSIGGPGGIVQNGVASETRPLASADYSTSFRSRSAASGVKTDAATSGGALVAGGQMPGIALQQQQSASPALTRAEPDLAKRELALAEQLGRAVGQSSVATRSDAEVAGSLQASAGAVSATPAPVAGNGPTPGFAGVQNDGIVAGATDTWRRQNDDTAQAVRFYRAPVLAERGILSESEARQRNDLASGGFRVLDRFSIEQQTNMLRVVDGDGSVYEGFVDGPTVASNTEAPVLNFSDGLERQKATLAKDAVGQSQRGYSFNASGSNVTLRRFVEISGRFIADTNATNQAVRSSSRATTTAALASRRALTQTDFRGGNVSMIPNTTNSAAIEGVIRIGKDPQQPFRALKQGR